MVDYCIAELRYKVRIFEETGIVKVHHGDVVKSDTIIPASLKEELNSAVEPLEDVPADKQDWRPGSNDQILDLVHPSLYPLVYGYSRILPDSLTSLEDCIERCGEGIVVPVPQPLDGDSENLFSRKFQWLPYELDISGDDDNVK